MTVMTMMMMMMMMMSDLSVQCLRQVPDDVTGQCAYRYLGSVIIDILYSYHDDTLG